MCFYLVSGNSKLKEGDLVLLQELHVLIRVVLENECPKPYFYTCNVSPLLAFVVSVHHSFICKDTNQRHDLVRDLQDTLETELLQKGKVLLLGETTAIDPGRDHVEVVRRAEVLRVG